MGTFLYVTQSIRKECCFSLILGLTQGLNQGLWWRVEGGGWRTDLQGHDLSHRCKNLMMQWECCLSVPKTPSAV